MRLILKIWRQKDAQSRGAFKTYRLDSLGEDLSFLEMLDRLNAQLIKRGERPVEFDHDCREGICGQCGVMIKGIAHGPLKHTTSCQLYMRSFKDGETLYVEPFRARAFPVVCDLRIDRSALDSLIASGGYIAVDTGQAPEANSIPIAHPTAEAAFDAAACIGCGACVATCKNASAALFTAAKIAQLATLPQGRQEASTRVLRMVAKMEELGFGPCSNTEACQVECPQDISVLHIGQMNYEYNKARLRKAKR